MAENQKTSAHARDILLASPAARRLVYCHIDAMAFNPFAQGRRMFVERAIKRVAIRFLYLKRPVVDGLKEKAAGIRSKELRNPQPIPVQLVEINIMILIF